ncbi:MAG: hypothetical protein IRY95_03950 [Clostridia bacterium]|nr:hypothetical protein [Clostridia bacterium]
MTGFPLEAALEVLAAHGWTCQGVRETTAPGGRPEGVAFVVRQRPVAETVVELVVAWPGFAGSLPARGEGCGGPIVHGVGTVDGG